MGLRSYKRQIAKARLTAAGVGNVNSKLATKNADGLPNWKKALYGESGQAAEKALIMAGRKKVNKRIVSRRKLKKVSE